MGIECIAFIATSLDGYIAKTDGNIDWLNNKEYDIDGEDFGFFNHMNKIDSLIMGRNTFELAASFDKWYYTGKHVYVLSSGTPEIPERLSDTVSVVTGNLVDVLNRIKNKGHKCAYIDGGKTIQSFIRESLLDEITITRIPILLGGGIPLFGYHADEIPLRHIETKIYDNGFVRSRYVIERT